VIYTASPLAVTLFFLFVAITLGLSFYLGKKAKSSAGYFAAHGQIPWFVNGVAFAGDYLSAASFLGICGMIAFYGYDGFLYSIGYLAGWVVALFVVAEPMKRLGKFTFADALNSTFDSRGIQLAAGVSTLAVSIFYLIPQMVGAGVLIQPLLGMPHWAGVVLVGATVMIIVVTAGMVSTTWVQFLKGSLLVIFSAVLTLGILQRGFDTTSSKAEEFVPRTLGPLEGELPQAAFELPELVGKEILISDKPGYKNYLQTKDSTTGAITFWRLRQDPKGTYLDETQFITKTDAGQTYVNGLPKGTDSGEAVLRPVGRLSELPTGKESTGPLGPLEFFSTLQESEVVLWGSDKIVGEQEQTTIYYPKYTHGSQVLRPGEHPAFEGIRSDKFSDKLNFLRNGFLAAHPHSILYRAKRSSGPQEHDCGHHLYWFLLRIDALHGTGSDDQWRTRCVRQQYGSALVGTKHE